MSKTQDLQPTERMRKRPWDVFMPCSDRATCEDAYHVRTARKRFRQAIKLDLYGFAEVLHDARCDMWAQGDHGGIYADMAVDYCGPERHIQYIAQRLWVKTIYELHHKGTAAPETKEPQP